MLNHPLKIDVGDDVAVHYEDRKHNFFNRQQFKAPCSSSWLVFLEIFDIDTPTTSILEMFLDSLTKVIDRNPKRLNTLFNKILQNVFKNWLITNSE